MPSLKDICFQHCNKFLGRFSADRHQGIFATKKNIEHQAVVKRSSRCRNHWNEPPLDEFSAHLVWVDTAANKWAYFFDGMEQDNPIIREGLSAHKAKLNNTTDEHYYPAQLEILALGSDNVRNLQLLDVASRHWAGTSTSPFFT